MTNNLFPAKFYRDDYVVKYGDYGGDYDDDYGGDYDDYGDDYYGHYDDDEVDPVGRVFPIITTTITTNSSALALVRG